MSSTVREVDREALRKAILFHGSTLVHKLTTAAGSSNVDLLLEICKESKATSSALGKRGSLHGDRRQTAVDGSIAEFIVDNTPLLFPSRYDADTLDATSLSDSDVPCFENYIDDLSTKLEQTLFFEAVKPGDVLCCRVKESNISGLTVTLLCVAKGSKRDVESCDIQVFIPAIQLPDHYLENGLPAINKKQILKVRVSNVSLDPVALTLTLFSDDERVGPIEEEDLPLYYRAAKNRHNSDSFDKNLRRCQSLRNPACESNLCGMMSIDLRPSSSQLPLTFLPSLKQRDFSCDAFAPALKNMQLKKMADISLTKGISHFREGRNNEALQLINKALQFQENHVDALVARGALYANGESFDAAVTDLERAHALNLAHKNARAYLIETLMSKGRLHESIASAMKRPKHDSAVGEKQTRERKRAARCYVRVLELQSNHPDATDRLASCRRIRDDVDLSFQKTNTTTPKMVSDKKRDAVKQRTTGSNKKRRRSSFGSSSSIESVSVPDVITLEDENPSTSDPVLPVTLESSLEKQLSEYKRRHSATMDNGGGDSVRVPENGNSKSNKTDHLSRSSSVEVVSSSVDATKKHSTSILPPSGSRSHGNVSLRQKKRTSDVVKRSSAVKKPKDGVKVEKKLLKMESFIEKLKSKAGK